MTDRSVVDKVAEAMSKVMSADNNWHARDDDYRRMAQAAIDAMQLTRQTRETWPSEESGVSGPLHETCWQTPWVVGDD